MTKNANETMNWDKTNVSGRLVLLLHRCLFHRPFFGFLGHSLEI